MRRWHNRTARLAPCPSRGDFVPPACLALVFSASWSRRSVGGVARLTPISHPLARRDTPRTRARPSSPVLLSGESQRYYAPLRHPTRLPRPCGSESRDPSPRGASRVALCSVSTATPPTPVSDRPFIGRFLRRDPAAFPVLMAGRRSRFSFEACAGFTCVAARRLADPPSVGLCPESFDASVTLRIVSVATGVHRQLPRPDSHRREHSTFHGAHEKGPAARRRPKAAGEAYFLYVEPAAEGAVPPQIEPLSSL